MGQLVDHRDPDLLGQVVRVREVVLQRHPEERDPVRDHQPVGVPLGLWHALVQAVQVVVQGQPVVEELLVRGPIVDYDRHLGQRLAERLRNGRDRPIHEPLEAFRRRSVRVATTALSFSHAGPS